MNAPAPPNEYDHFSTLNALVDRDWLGRLKKVELDVFICYLRHADGKTGIAFPGPTRIAKRLGHKKINHVCTARRRLVALGFLTPVQAGKYRVGVPHPGTDSPDSGLLIPKRVVPEPDENKSQSRTKGSPQSGPKAVPNRDSEQLIDQTKEQTNRNSSAGVVGFLSEEEERKRAAREALKSAGIKEPTRSRLVDEIPGLSAEVVAEIERDMDGNAGTGLLVEAIRADAADVLEELEARRQRVESIAQADAERAVERRAWADGLAADYLADRERNDAICAAIVDYRVKSAGKPPEVAAQFEGAATRYMLDQQKLLKHELIEQGEDAVCAGMPPEALRMMAIHRGRGVSRDVIAAAEREYDDRHAIKRTPEAARAEIAAKIASLGLRRGPKREDN